MLPCASRSRAALAHKLRVEEQAAEDGTGAGLAGELDLDVSGDVPAQVRPVLEARDGLGAEDGAVGRVDDLDQLGAGAVTVPVEQVGRELVGLAVGEVDIDGERGPAVPAG